jgi:6-phosphogluconate dehydrogenase
VNPSSVDLNRREKLDPARAGAAPARPFAGWVTTLGRPSATWIMVPAAIVDSTLDGVAPRRAPDDAVICDGGDSHGLRPRADLRRAKWLASSECAVPLFL